MKKKIKKLGTRKKLKKNNNNNENASSNFVVLIFSISGKSKQLGAELLPHTRTLLPNKNF